MISFKQMSPKRLATLPIDKLNTQQLQELHTALTKAIGSLGWTWRNYGRPSTTEENELKARLTSKLNKVSTQITARNICGDTRK